MADKLNALKLTDDNENVSELDQYAWLPPGLEPDLVIFDISFTNNLLFVFQSIDSFILRYLFLQ